MSLHSYLHLLAGSVPPTAHCQDGKNGKPIGNVRFGNGLSVSSDSPAVLTLIAETFADAARQLAAALDTPAGAA